MLVTLFVTDYVIGINQKLRQNVGLNVIFQSLNANYSHIHNTYHFTVIYFFLYNPLQVLRFVKVHQSDACI